MKIIVCIKQVPDTETKLKLKGDATGIDETGVKWVINPYDEFAVEEALKQKEANAGSTVHVFSVGPQKRVVESIRTALAMGADEGYVIDAPENIDSLTTAQALAKAIQQEGAFDLVFTGKLAIDDNNASVSQMVAEFLSIPHATVISKFTNDGGKYTVEREVEGGTKEIIQLTGPSLIGANKGLNMPRYASLPGIMKAKKKTIKEIKLDALGLHASSPKLTYSDFKLPQDKPPVKMLSGEAQQQASLLAKALREEAKVI